jgi:hypothetical protein
MVRDNSNEAEGHIHIEHARQEGRFSTDNMNQLSYDCKTSDKFSYSDFARQRSSLPTSSDAFIMTTRDVEDPLEELTDRDLRAKHFKSKVTDVLDNHLVGDLDLVDDLLKRLDVYARMYTNTKGPNLLFILLDDDAESPVKF